jgi:aryl-alcohol dehydrogenase-like predicted oxidoreductase
METRPLGRTGYRVSAIGFGAWALGGDWGDVTEEQGMAAMHTALDEGVTFFDTADVYGAGRSERLVARLRRERPGEDFVVATKVGRRLMPDVAGGFAEDRIEGWVDDSLRNTGFEALDLVQLHCPPTDLYYRPELFDEMARLRDAGKVLHWGVSVERSEEGMKAIEFPVVETVQIVFNAFRQRPAEVFFPRAQALEAGVIARVPLASGLLTGKMNRETTFAADDHRAFNREGEAFDVGETFAGVPFEVGVDAAEELRPLVPGGMTMAQFALRWVLVFDAVSTVIPGAKNPDQARQNAAAAGFPPPSEETMAAIREVYDRRIRPHVHQRW